MIKEDAISVSSTLNGQRLTSTVTAPKGLRKYFNSFRLYAHYDASMNADSSILNIPAVSTVLPLSWLTGTDVHAEKLDKKYVEAIDAIKHEFNLMFPRGTFTTKIDADELVENKTETQGTAMLFSGGVDSTYSLIRNISLRPRLIMFFGVLGYQLDPSYKKHNQLVRKTYSDFAKREGLDISFVETNTCQVLNDCRIAHDFHKTLRGSSLWEGLQLPLVILSLPAPLSIGRFNRLLDAADVSETYDFYRYPYASQPRINEKFAWADVRVMLDGYIDRLSKTNLIKEYLRKHEYLLRVCNDPPPDRLNCGTCEKCARTIAPLVLEGIDPNNCGFKVDKSTFQSMRHTLERTKFEGWMGGRYKKLQKSIPHRLETNLYGERDFFMWLRNVDIDSIQKRRNLHRDLSNLLPYHLGMLLGAFYCSVHDRSTSRSINTLVTSFLRRRAGQSRESRICHYATPHLPGCDLTVRPELQQVSTSDNDRSRP